MLWILYVIVLILLGSAAYASMRGAPWVPTWKKDMERVKRLANLQSGEKFIELGCGNGRVCRYIAENTSAHSVGVELSIIQWAIAKLLTWRSASGKKARILFGDVFHQDLSQYDVVYMFLMPETYKKIRDKLTRELRSGARVITYVWSVPGWQASYVDEVKDSPSLYVYVKK